MRFYIDGTPTDYAHAYRHAAHDAAQAGMDLAEFQSIFQRACRADEDGFYARDELARFCASVEILAQA